MLWLENGDIYNPTEEGFRTRNSIPVGIYDLKVDPKKGWYLHKTTESFVFSYKIYGLETDFCDYVIKTYENTKGNLGILFTGIKGTGKTVTAKILANRLKLPVVIVKDFGDGNQEMIEFLNSFNFDVVLFLDEFEKNFDADDTSILQIMDGVYNMGYRKVFLLTTNLLSVNDNLIGRPSRIRYIRRFNNLSLDVVKEYLSDNLVSKESTQELLGYIDSLEYSTIDILKSIVEEVNIHGITEFKKNKKNFNIAFKKIKYSGVILNLAIETKYSTETFLKNVKEFIASEGNDYDEFSSRLRYNSIFSEKPFSKLSPGDIITDDEDGGGTYKIKKVDINRKVIISECTKYSAKFLTYFWVCNPEERPSLYNEVSSY